MHRGRDVLQVLDQYEKTVKPSFESYILPTKKYADIIVSSCTFLLKLQDGILKLMLTALRCRFREEQKTQLPLTSFCSISNSDFPAG